MAAYCEIPAHSVYDMFIQYTVSIYLIDNSVFTISVFGVGIFFSNCAIS